MERDVEERFERSEKHAAIAERRSIHRHQMAIERMDLAEKRMEKFDQRLEATRKLVEAGMKIVVRMEQRQKALETSVRELAKSQKAFLDSLRKGGNGSRHVA